MCYLSDCQSLCESCMMHLTACSYYSCTCQAHSVSCGKIIHGDQTESILMSLCWTVGVTSILTSSAENITLIFIIACMRAMIKFLSDNLIDSFANHLMTVMQPCHLQQLHCRATAFPDDYACYNSTLLDFNQGGFLLRLLVFFLYLFEDMKPVTYALQHS